MSKDRLGQQAADTNTPIDRAEVIREFLALDNRTAEIADAYAARIGLWRSQFYRLVQTFEETRDRLTETHGSTGQARLDNRVEGKIEAVIDHLA